MRLDYRRHRHSALGASIMSVPASGHHVGRNEFVRELDRCYGLARHVIDLAGTQNKPRKIKDANKSRSVS